MRFATQKLGVIRQCKQPVVILRRRRCTTLASTNCNHGFSISQPQGDRDFANCLARTTVRISSQLRRFGDKVLASQVSVSESENQRRLWNLDENKIFFIFPRLLTSKKIFIRIGRGTSYCKVNYARTRLRALVGGAKFLNFLYGWV